MSSNHKKIFVISPIPVPSGVSLEEDVKRLSIVAGPDTEVICKYIESAPESIEGKYEDSLAVPGTVEAAIQAEKEGADAVVINCTADTALHACRECLSIPVIAPTMVSYYLAAELAHSFSVLTFSRTTIVRFEEMAWRWGLWNKLKSVRSIEIPYLEINAGDAEFVEELFRIGQECVNLDGAHALIMGCTAFEIVSQFLRERFKSEDMPVLIIEPYLAALRMAELMVSTGINQSKLTYPLPEMLSI